MESDDLAISPGAQQGMEAQERERERERETEIAAGRKLSGANDPLGGRSVITPGDGGLTGITLICETVGG